MKSGQLASIPGPGTVLTVIFPDPKFLAKKVKVALVVFLLVIQGLCVYLRKLVEQK